jgi:DNA-binding MarR family transcriptional regulator
MRGVYSGCVDDAYRSYPYPGPCGAALAREDNSVQLEKAGRQLKLTTRDYAQLAGFRHALLGFLRFSEGAAAEAGLTSQHYQALLVLRGWPQDRPVSISDLAQQLLIKHNSAVGLVDRLAAEGLVTRETSSTDRRKVELALSPRGRQVLAKLASMHRRELERIGPVLQRLVVEASRAGRYNEVESSKGKKR